MPKKTWTSKLVLSDCIDISKAISKIKKKCQQGQFRFVAYKGKTYPICWGNCRTCGLKELLLLIKEINSPKS